MKKILIIFIFLFFPVSTLALETVPAGFVAPPRFMPEKLEAGRPARVYATLFNDSSLDIIGLARLYQNDQSVGEVKVTLPARTTVRYWFDVTIATGTIQFRGELTEMKKTELGKTPEEIQLATSSIKISKESTALMATSTFSSSASSSTNVITVSSPTSSGEGTSTSSSSSSSTLPTILGSSIAKTATEKTKNIVEMITSPFANFLDTKKRALEEEIKTTATSTPLPVLDKAATELEKKTTFLKIPREQLPGMKHIYIWLISAATFILRTWWIMLIIFAVLIRLVWKLWRRLRADEYND